MDGDKSVTAVFVEIPPDQVTLSLTVDPAESGSIDQSGSGTYDENSTATLEAIPATGFAFDHWEGDLTGSDNPDDLLMDTNKSVTAVFVELPKTLTASVSPIDSGTVTQSGNGSYDKGSTATIEGVPAEGYLFDHWEGDATGTDNPLELLMDDNKTVTAVFALIPPPVYSLTKTASPVEGGTVTDDGEGNFVEGSMATVTANPAEGYLFDHWEGDAAGTENPIEIFMDGNKEITAVFTEIPPNEYALNTAVSPAGAGSVATNGSGTYEEGTTAIAEAVPAAGYIFDHWEGSSDSTNATINLTMDANKSLTAVFAEDESDADEDGLTAFAELTQYNTDPNKKDSDGDKINDGDEVGTIFDPATDDTATLQLLASNPEFYLGLILSASAVFPEIVIEKTESNDFVITIQIEKTDNLKDWEALDLSDAVIDGDTITLTIPASETLRFIRSKSSR